MPVPDDVRRAVHTLRDAGFDNISLDLIYGIPGQSAADLEADLADALALEPEHLSCYELEAKPGTRFTHAHGEELARQAEAMEGYAERVVETLTGAGYRWYETANFCRTTAAASSARSTTWRSGVVPTTSASGSGRCRRSATSDGGTCPRSGGTWRRSRAGEDPPREVERLDAATRAVERLMLGLRLDEPFADRRERARRPSSISDALERLVERGLVERRNGGVRLTPRGRLLGDAVTAELLA